MSDTGRPTIKVTCRGADTLQIDRILEFQGKLKHISQTNKDRLKSSILRHGFTAPLFVWDDNGEWRLLDGHQRLSTLLSMRKDGYDIPMLPVDYIEAADEKEAKEKLLNITSQYGEFDMDELNEWVSECDEELQQSLRLVDEELELSINSTDEVDTVGDDDIPEDVEPITKLGDLWELGNHRLLCGDSTVKKNILNVLKNMTPHVYIVDPPYEIEQLYDVIPEADKSKLVVFWDFKRFATAAYSAKIKEWEPQYEFIWDNLTSWYTPNRPLARHKACGVFSKDPKFNFDKAIIRDGKQREAKVVHNTRGDSNYKPLDGAVHLSTIFVTNKAGMSTGGHTHGKPIAWIEAIFNGIGGSIYLDYFAGSGSSIIACEKTERICCAIELEPSNCDIIVNRYKNWCDENSHNYEIKLNGGIFSIDNYVEP